MLISWTAVAEETGYAAELRVIDLASFASVRNFVSGLQNEPIDIIVANAGISQAQCIVTDDGWEQSWVMMHYTY